MLDGAGGSAGIELFHTSTALFVENQGQWEDEAVRYGFQGTGVNIAFTDDGLSFLLTQQESDIGSGDQLDEPGSLAIRSTQFSVSFDGANKASPLGLDAGESRFNYFVGDQTDWRSGVQGYKTVAYEDLYEGIDLHTFGKRSSLKYEFYVAPGANYEQIEISYDGIGELWIDDEGQLRVETELGTLVDDAPYIYQMVDGEQIEVAGEFKLLDADTYTFEITGSYDPTLELVIDPDLSWSTYLGAGGSDSAHGLAIANDGSVLVSGDSGSPGWVSGGGDTSYNGSWDAIVVKLDADGNHIWSSYLGGTGYDQSGHLTVDEFGNVVVVGGTESSGWISGGWDTTYGGSRDGFVAQLDADGNHVWSSYLGSTGFDYASGVASDAFGNVVVTGTTPSSGWVSGGEDTSHNGGNDGFVAYFTVAGTHVWSTYIGGSNDDFGAGIGFDPDTNILIGGTTGSAGWVAGGWDTSFGGGGGTDGFVLKLDADGNTTWSTYFGGYGGSDGSEDIVTDEAGNVYVVGNASSSGWASGGWDTSYGGAGDGYILKLNADGSHAWSSYFGGSGLESGRAIAVAPSGSIYVSGYTQSSGWIVGGWDTTYDASADAFVIRFEPDGSHTWSSYIGDVGLQWGDGIAVDADSRVTLVGETDSSLNFITGGWDTSFGGGRDGFVVRIDDFFVVNTTSDTPDANPGDGVAEDASGNVSLRAAVQEANALGVPTRIVVPAGVYSLTRTGAEAANASYNDLDVTDSITIEGAGAGLTVIDSSGLATGGVGWHDQTFHVLGELNLSGVTITGGHSKTGGAIVVNNGDLIVTDSAFVDNESDGAGGAIRISGSTGYAQIERSVFEGNTAGTGGGAIYAGDQSTATVEIGSSVFANNTAGTAFANVRVEPDASSSKNLGNNVVDSDQQQWIGGVLTYFFSTATGDHIGAVDHVVTTIDDEIDASNDAYAFSMREAVQAANSTNDTIFVPAWRYELDRTGTESSNAAYNDLDITGNVSIVGVGAGLTVIDASALASSDGVGWHDQAFHITGDLDLSRVTITGGHSKTGGAIVVAGGDLNATDSAFVDNESDGAGGAIRISGSTGYARIERSVFEGNKAATAGGAIYAGDQDTATVEIGSSVFANNTAGTAFHSVRVEPLAASSTNLGDNLVDSDQQQWIGGVLKYFFETSQGDYIGSAGYVVTSVADGIRAQNDTYSMTLREAVLAANASSGSDEVWLAPWLYLLTVEGSSEQYAATGDLDVRENMTTRTADDATVDASLISDAAFEEIGATHTLDTDLIVVN